MRHLRVILKARQTVVTSTEGFQICTFIQFLTGEKQPICEIVLEAFPIDMTYKLGHVAENQKSFKNEGPIFFPTSPYSQ